MANSSVFSYYFPAIGLSPRPPSEVVAESSALAEDVVKDDAENLEAVPTLSLSVSEPSVSEKDQAIHSKGKDATDEAASVHDDLSKRGQDEEEKGLSAAEDERSIGSDLSGRSQWKLRKSKSTDTVGRRKKEKRDRKVLRASMSTGEENNEDLKELEKENEALEETVNLMVDELESQKNSFEGQVTDLAKSLDDARDSLQEEAEAKRLLQEEMRKVQATLEQTVNKMAAELKAQKALHEDQVADLRNELAKSLTGSLEMTGASQGKRCGHDGHEHKEVTLHLMEKVSDLTECLEGKDGGNAKLRSDIEDARPLSKDEPEEVRIPDEMVDQKRSYEEQISHLQDQVSGLEQSLEEARSSCQVESEEDVDRIRNDVITKFSEEMAVQKSSYEEQISNLMDQVCGLTQSLEEARSSCQVDSEEDAAFADEIVTKLSGELAAQKSSHVEEVAKLTEQVDDVTLSLKEAGKSFDEQVNENAKSADQASTIALLETGLEDEFNMNVKLKEALQENKKQVSDLTDSLKEARKECKNEAEARRSLQEEMHEVEETLEETRISYKEQIGDLQTSYEEQVASLAKSLAEAEAAREQDDKAKDLLQDEMEEVTTTLEEAKNQLVTQKSSHEGKVESLTESHREQVINLTESLEEARTSWKDEAGRNARLQKEVERVRKSAANLEENLAQKIGVLELALEDEFKLTTKLKKTVENGKRMHQQESEENEKLRKMAEEHAIAIDDWQRRVEEETDANTQLAEEAADLQCSLDEERDASSKLKRALEGTRESLGNESCKNANLQRELDALKQASADAAMISASTIAQLEKNLEDEFVSSEKIEGRLEDTEKKYQDESNKNAALQKALDDAKRSAARAAKKSLSDISLLEKSLGDELVRASSLKKDLRKSKEDHQKSNKEHEASVQKMTEEHQSAVATLIEEKDAAAEEHKAAVAKTSEEHKASIAEMIEEQEAMTAKMMEEYQSAREKHKSALAKMMEQNNAMAGEAEKHKEAAEKMKADHKSAVAAMKEDCEAALDKLAQEQKAAKASTLKKHKAALAKLTEAHKKSMATIEEDHKANAEKTAKNHNAAIAKLEKSLQEKSESVSQLEKQVNGLRKSLEHEQSAISTLAEDYASIEAKLDSSKKSSKKERARSDHQREQLLRELEDARNQLDAERTKLKSTEESLGDAERRLSTSEARGEELSGKLEEAKGDNASLRAEAVGSRDYQSKVLERVNRILEVLDDADDVVPSVNMDKNELVGLVTKMQGGSNDVHAEAHELKRFLIFKRR